MGVRMLGKVGTLFRDATVISHSLTICEPGVELIETI